MLFARRSEGPAVLSPTTAKDAGMGDETKVQIRDVKKGMEAMGSMLERYLIR
jgi:hypothetical protein